MALNYQKQTCTLMAGKNKGEVRTYATVITTGRCNTEQLADHISEKYRISRGDCYRFLEALFEGVYNQLSTGKTVEIGPLGRFRLTLKSELCENPDDFNARRIKEVKLHFTPGKRIKNRLQNIPLRAR